MNIPHTQPANWPKVAATRFAATIRSDRMTGCAIALLGLPDDTGVRLNQGRPGAARGPAAFRAALATYGSAEPAAGPWPKVYDAGDVVPGDSLGETHNRVTAVTEALLKAGLLPVAIGGGHDLTFPFVRAVTKKFSPLAGLYFDAHLDVRATAGSGMAFRKLVETCDIKALHLHGFQPMVNARNHLEWFKANGGTVQPDQAPIKLPPGKNLFASFDLDVLDAAHAPGVSALNPAGWTVREAEAWVRASGADARVRCFDLMELNPVHDPAGRTARVAAHLFLTFLQGYAQR